MDDNKLGLGIGGRGKPGKSVLVKNNTAVDMATLRDIYGLAQDPFNGDTLIFGNLQSAIDACRDGLGDTIFLAPGYTETIATAAAVTVNCPGVSIIGLGNKDNRPVFTFNGVVGASILVSANDVRIENVVGLAGLDSLTNPFNVTGDGFSCDIEWQDTSNAVEALRAMRLDTANNADVKIKYLGFTGGNAVVNAVLLDDCDNVKIELDVFGICTTGWVQFVDVASTNVSVRGRVYTHGITNYSRNVVDTITGSVWDAEIFDSSYGNMVVGGSAAALAPVGGSTGTPQGASLAADVKAFAGLAYRGKADSDAGGGLQSIEIAELAGFGDDYFNDKFYLICLKNANSVGSAPEGEKLRVSDYVSATGTFSVDVPGFTANLEASDEFIVVHESIASLSERVGGIVSKNYANMAGFDGGTAFTVTGDVMVRCFGVVGSTAITSTSGTTTLSVGAGELPDILLPATTIDNSDFAATDVWVDNDPAYDSAALGAGQGWVIVGGGADITITRNVDDITAGSLTLYAEWKPLSANGNVVAA